MQPSQEPAPVTPVVEPQVVSAVSSEPVPEVPVAPIIPTPQTPSDLPPVKRSGKPLLFVILLVIIFVGALGAFAFMMKQNESNVGGVPTPLPSPLSGDISAPSQFTKCSDIRDLVDEGDRLYVACHSGVAIVEKSTGKVIETITQAQGLSTGVATSLVKKGNILYIGSQDGMSIYDLNTKLTKKISVKEGLVSGSNIKINDDGDGLWISTFSGMSYYEIASGKLTNYTLELGMGSDSPSILEALVTSKSVFVSGSARSISRFDKQTKAWKFYSPGLFGDFQRMDVGSMAHDNQNIYISDSQRIWKAVDQVETNWNRLTIVEDKIKQMTGEQSSSYKLLGTHMGKVLILSNSLVFALNPLDDSVSVIYPERYEGETDNILRSGFFAMLKNSVLWASYQNADNEYSFLRSHDLTANQTTNYHLSRPVSLNRVVAVIDGKPIFLIGNTLQILEDGKFSKMVTLAGEFIEHVPTITYLPGTNKIFVYSQSCGQLCTFPKLLTYDFVEKSQREYSISADMTKELAVFGGSAANLYQVWVAKDYQKIGFAEYDKKKFFLLNLADGAWESMAALPPEGTIIETEATAFCNPSWKLNSPESLCSNTSRLSVVLGNKTYLVENSKLFEEENGVKSEIVLQVTAERYSPFGQQDEKRIQRLSAVGDQLFVGTNRGLIILNTQNDAQTLIDISKGLLDNDVTSFVVDADNKRIWVSHEWYGVAVVKY